MTTAADIQQPWLSGSVEIDSLLSQFYHWDYQTPSDTAIYYTFTPTDSASAGFGGLVSNTTAFSAEEQAAARQAIANGAAVTGIRFVEVADAAAADIHFANGDIMLANAVGVTAGSARYGYGADQLVSFYTADAYIYLDNAEFASWFTDPAPGTGGYQVLLHELGHALDLKHPHDGAITLPASQDNTGNTVMSYNWVGSPKAEYQSFDVDALQWWYGTDGLGGETYGGLRPLVLTGTAAADLLAGGGASDTLDGGAGDDTLRGGDGNDVLRGGPGSELMDGGAGYDVYFADATDSLVDSGGVDTVVVDVSWNLQPGFENLRLTGTLPARGLGNASANSLVGNAGANTLIGAAGDDELFGGEGGDDWLEGGSGNDSLFAGAEADRFVFREAAGSANADTLIDFGWGADKIVLDKVAFAALGTAGNFAVDDPRFYAAAGAAGGHDADDRIVYDPSAGKLFYDADGSGPATAQLVATLILNPSLSPLSAADMVVLEEAPPPPGTFNGTSGNDSLTGTEDNDTLNGLEGNDTLRGLGGDDLLDGGPGSDSLDGGTGNDTFKVTAGDVLVDAGGIDTVVSTVNWVLGAGFENLTLVGNTGLKADGNELANVVIGSDGNDTIWPGGGDDTVIGGAGNDSLGGNAGRDWVEGGIGNDTIGGGGDQDHFVFREFGAANADTMVSFASNWDDIQLDVAAFGALGANGRFASGDVRFFAAAGASAGHDADDRIVYDTTSGRLWYDVDGSGSGAAQLIGTVEGAPLVRASDIWVFGTPAPSGGTINGTEGDDTLTGTPEADTINGLGGDDSLVGNEGADSLNGGDGNDTLDGLNSRFADTDADVETLNGGLGDDVFLVDNQDDVLIDAGGTDTVVAENMSFTLPSGFENLVIHNDESEARETGIGNELDNVLGRPGGSGWHVDLHGLGGNDTLYGSPRDDNLFGGDGNDSLDGSFHLDSLDGGAGNDTLFGGADGGADDSLAGGAGADTFVIADPFGFVPDHILDFASGTDTIRIDGDVFANAGPSGSFIAGDERFFAAAGVTQAHDATDRVIYNTTTGDVFYDEDGTGASAAFRIATLPALVATDIEVVNGTPGQVINGTNGNDSLAGGPGNDTLNGFAGNDTIDGRAGVDSMVGGTGNDLYFVDDFGDAVVELENEGIDEVRTALSGYTLTAWVNNLTLLDQGQSQITAAGNDISNRLDASAFDVILQLDGFGAGDTLIGGSAGNELNGWAGDDSMIGGEGNDTFDGFNHPQDGNDTMDGRGGDDAFFVSPGDVIIDSSGNDTVFAQSSWTLAAGLENLTFWNTTFDEGIPGLVGIGNAVANVMDGRGGDGVRLDGKAGNDTLIGSLSVDQFVFSTAPGSGTADVITNFSGDRLVLDGGAMPAIGASGDFNSTDTRFHAAAGANAGHDADDRVVYNTSTGQLWYDADGSGSGAAQLIATLQGAPALSASNITVENGTTAPPPGGINGTEGNDFLNGTADDDVINGLGGNDTIWPNAGDDTVIGGPGNDSLGGNAGRDWVEGGVGNDTIGGGGDQDHFVFREFGAANADTMVSFASNWDDIQLDIAAFGALGANGRFASGDVRFFAAAGASAGHDADDRVVYDTTSGRLWYDADGSGSGAAQLIGTVEGAPLVRASDIWVFGTPAPSGGTINGTAGDDTLVGTDQADTINGLGGNDSIIGNEGADRLNGGDGNDTLDGWDAFFGGTDGNVETLDGGLGDDWLRVDNVNDVLIDAGGIDTVVAKNIDWTLAAGFENLVMNNGEAETRRDGIGNNLDNLLDGRSTNLMTTGGDGWHVFLEGRAGNDTLLGSSQEDTLFGGAGNDILTGNDDPDVFAFDVAPGSANADVVTDFTSATDAIQLDGMVHANSGPSGRFVSGDGRFHAGAGANAGHDGDDRVVYNTSTGQLWYDADGSGSGTPQLIATLQGAPALAASDIVIVNGSSPSGTIDGTEGDDTLTGGPGNDTINGRGGDDSLLGLGGDDRLDGGDGSDTVVGGDGNDTLVVGSLVIQSIEDVETADGGPGDDLYILGRGFQPGTAGSVVLSDAGGIDTISANLAWNLGAGFENLELRADGPVDVATTRGVGNELDNVITGVAAFRAANFLDGADGNDTLIGGDGSDVFSFAAGTGNIGQDVVDGRANFDSTGSLVEHDFLDFSGARSAVTVQFATGTAVGGGTGGSGGVTFVNIEAVIGTPFADRITGSGADERFEGGGGADTVNGGGGNDTYVVAAGDVLADTGGIDTIESDGNWNLGAEFENLTFLGSGNWQAQGNNLANVMTGNGGNNYFNSRAGNDTLLGMDGDDYFDISNGGTASYGNKVVDGGNGIDTVDFDGYAHSAVNANLAAGTVAGGGDGGAGTLQVTGIERFIGGSFNDSIVGSAANNYLDGRGGNDTVEGGAGNDTLLGQAGSDMFVYREFGTGNADQLTGFTSGADRLAFDDAVFSAYRGAGDFGTGGDADDRLIYNTATGQLFYDDDGAGAHAAQLVTTLTGAPTLAASDITLI